MSHFSGYFASSQVCSLTAGWFCIIGSHSWEISTANPQVIKIHWSKIHNVHTNMSFVLLTIVAQKYNFFFHYAGCRANAVLTVNGAVSDLECIMINLPYWMEMRTNKIIEVTYEAFWQYAAINRIEPKPQSTGGFYPVSINHIRRLSEGNTWVWYNHLCSTPSKVWTS